MIAVPNDVSSLIFESDSDAWGYITDVILHGGESVEIGGSTYTASNFGVKKRTYIPSGEQLKTLKVAAHEGSPVVSRDYLTDNFEVVTLGGSGSVREVLLKYRDEPQKCRITEQVGFNIGIGDIVNFDKYKSPYPYAPGQ